MFLIQVYILLLLIVIVTSFTFRNNISLRRQLTTLFGKVAVGNTNEIPVGERKIVETSAGSVVVANVDGSFYAVNAKCPHLGLPMKKGAIEKDSSGTPIITCNFHNSKFSMTDGSCKVWCSGVMGMPGTGFLAGAMGKMGGKENTPATAYPVMVEEDGKLFLEI